MNKKGFTLIELLATIIVLSLVVGITIYFGGNAIEKAKEKTYQITLNNISKVANNYLKEYSNNLEFIPLEGSINEYQCVTVKEIKEKGYFDENILKSEYEKDRKVLETDTIYVERNINTKVVNKIEYNKPDKCGSVRNALADIYFSVSETNDPSKKEVTITYKLKNYTNINEYKFGYSTNQSDLTNPNKYSTSKVQKIIITEDTTIYAGIVKNDDYSNLIYNESYTVKIDKVEPEPENDCKNIQMISSTAVSSGAGLYQDTEETGRYVYRGAAASVNNNITFNGQTGWRIIAFEADGTVKIMGPATLITATQTYGGSGDVNYKDSTLRTNLNGSLFYNGMTTKAKEQIKSSNLWSHSGSTWGSGTSSTFKVGTNIFDKEKTSRTDDPISSYVGLMDLSDYVKAASTIELEAIKNLSVASISESGANVQNIKNNNWIYDTNTNNDNIGIVHDIHGINFIHVDGRNFIAIVCVNHDRLFCSGLLKRKVIVAQSIYDFKQIGGLPYRNVSV